MSLIGKGLGEKSAIMSSVGSCFTSTIPFFTWSDTQNALILRCLVRCPLLVIPFLSSRMALILSCSNLILPPFPFCASIKYLVQIACVSTSSAATSSVSVKLFVFIFCLVEIKLHVLRHSK